MKQLLFGRLTAVFAALTAIFQVNGQTAAPLSLPSLFTDHMVLQRNSDVSVWGWGNASSTVNVVGSWNPADTVSATINDCGRWNVALPTSGAGGPYTIDIFYHGQPSTTISIKDVMLGEVWLCSGQSNMEWTPGNGINNSDDEIAAAQYPKMRFFSIPKYGSDTPQDNCLAKWEICSPEVMARRSAVAYFFGRDIHQALDSVPVGLIVAAWGGTRAEVWLPDDSIMSNPLVVEELAKDKNYPWWPVRPGVLYNAMIHPVMPYSIAGTIWYQGESNRIGHQSYGIVMKKIIESWRDGFDNQFPFLMVQIAPFNYESKKNEPAEIREFQAEVARTVPGVGLVPTIDIGDPGNIHPKEKATVGRRLANMALGRVYGALEGGFEAPEAISAERHNNKAIIRFSNADNGITASEKTIRGLRIAGADNIFTDARSRIRNNTLEIWSPDVKLPVTVTYCYDDATLGTLFNAAGLPVLPFRLTIDQ